MNAKQLLKQLVPPIVFALQKRLSNNRRNAGDEYFHSATRTYANYLDALKHSDSNAYEADDLVDVVAVKTRTFLEKMKADLNSEIPQTSLILLAGVLFSRLTCKSHRLRVVDLGGACGIHYFQMKNILGDSCKLNWIVVESKAMVTRARDFQTDELSFSDNLEDAISRTGTTVDLMHTSSTIQYLNEPYRHLGRVFDSKAKHILFNRMSVSLGDHDVISVQTSLLSSNGAGPLPTGFADRTIRYPHTNIQKSIFETMLMERYETVFSFEEKSGVHKVGNEPIVGLARFCKLKS